MTIKKSSWKAVKLLSVYQRIIFKSKTSVREEYEYKVFGRKGGTFQKTLRVISNMLRLAASDSQAEGSFSRMLLLN